MAVDRAGWSRRPAMDGVGEFPMGLEVAGHAGDAVVFAVYLADAALAFQPGPVYLPLIIAFMAAVNRGHRRVAYAVLVAGYLVAIGVVGLGGRSSTLAFALGLAAWFLVLAAGAEIIRIRGQARRAQVQEAAQAAETRSEDARRRAGDERLRIARDLHDVLAHQLALITVQANVGLALLGRDPARSDPVRDILGTHRHQAHPEHEEGHRQTWRRWHRRQLCPGGTRPADGGGTSGARSHRHAVVPEPRAASG
jgi:hypothetical protein